ncbi:unnamed protein product [Taenia asiatica]|uniref:Expressed conserved protein n=1 Tax=Taenia asiatica TaxID=60517 RepID=A0A0R3VVQ8_TAEAS|nr:unnamed protein product [Taenia asiatica]
MNTKAVHISAFLFTALLLFVPLFFHGFNCSGNVFSAECGRVKYLQIMGGLTLGAGALMCTAALIITLTSLCNARCLHHTAISVVTLSTILTAAAVILYYNYTKAWSPFMATMAMVISFVHTSILVIDVGSRLMKTRRT